MTPPPPQTIDMSELLFGRRRASEVIDAVTTIAPSDPSYEVALKYLERRQAASRSTVEVGIAATAILLGLTAIFTEDLGWILPVLLSLVTLSVTLWASLNAGGDEHRITKLQIAAADGQTSPDVPRSGNPFVALMRTLGF
jgi:uncharacterized protein (DUF1684 family)